MDLWHYWLFKDQKSPDHNLAYLCDRNKLLERIIQIAFTTKGYAWDNVYRFIMLFLKLHQADRESMGWKRFNVGYHRNAALFTTGAGKNDNRRALDAYAKSGIWHTHFIIWKSTDDFRQARNKVCEERAQSFDSASLDR